MAVGIQNYPNIDTTDPTGYPNGSIKDDPLGVTGTPINRLTTDDINQTFDRALTRSGLTATGDPDNVTNGYQYADAFGLEQWVDAGDPVVVSGFTYGVAGTIFNKYCITGAKLDWQLYLDDVTISGSPTVLEIELPADIGDVRNKGTQLSAMRYMAGVYNLYTPMIVQVTGTNTIRLYLVANAAFTNASSQTLQISLRTVVN